MKQWLMILGGMVLALATTATAVAFSMGNGGAGTAQEPGGHGIGGAPPVTSLDDIDPDACNWVHNIEACEGAGLGPDRPVASGPGAPSGGQPGSGLRPAHPAAPPNEAPNTDGMVRELAPIERAELIVAESFPPQYFVHVTFGLANGCIRPGGYEVAQQGKHISITVWVLRPADPGVVCTMVYGIAEYTIPLGDGEGYTVSVNGKEVAGGRGE